MRSTLCWIYQSNLYQYHPRAFQFAHKLMSFSCSTLSQYTINCMFKTMSVTVCDVSLVKPATICWEEGGGAMGANFYPYTLQ